MMMDVNVVLVDFPKGKEMVVENSDGTYTIMINAHLNYESQQLAYQHAMEHINNNDFEKSDVQSIEATAHHLPTLPPEATYQIAQVRRKKRRKRNRFEAYYRKMEQLRMEFPEYFSDGNALDRHERVALGEHF